MLLETITALLELEPPAAEILIVDQTDEHDRETVAQLSKWGSAGVIDWQKLSTPSIPGAMNHGLLNARSPLVLFLDDDIVPLAGLISGHVSAHMVNRECWASVGQVLQPWQRPEYVQSTNSAAGLEQDFDFPFHSTIDADTTNVMAGNLCVNRERALSIGGFDENFVGPAYRFETDFARRLIQAGGRIRFAGAAGIQHLRAESGGTRIHGSHLTSASPIHGFGDYYYAFRHGKGFEAWKYGAKRMFREVRTRFHLTHPWWIPVKLVGESRALMWGFRASRRNPKLIEKPI